MLSVRKTAREANSATYAAKLLRSASLSQNPDASENVCVVGSGGTHGDWFLVIFLGDDAAAQSRSRRRNRTPQAELQ
jgi:hypothetical protein